jgi:hypothetical protein
MDKFRRNIRDLLNFIKEYLYVAICEKLFLKSIFALEKIPEFAETNQRTLAQINNDEKKVLMKGLEYISEYNQDFDHLRAEYIISSTEKVNFSKFQIFLQTEKSGFYIKKATLKFIFKILLVLLQLLILIYYYPKHFCVNESIDDKLIDDNTMFWIYDSEKYKVKKGFNEPLFYLRIVSFISEFILVVGEYNVLSHLKRIKTNLFMILIFQLFRLAIFVIICVNQYYGDVCQETAKKNIFYRKEKKFNFLELATFIYDLYKIVIY